VWQVLTDRRALADWMMENDFEPKLGHKFRFYNPLLPGFTTTIQCEVVELEKPTRLVYTWQESSTAEPSLVIWTLTTVAGGTQLRLRHHQYRCTTAVGSINRSGTTYQPGAFYSGDSEILSLPAKGALPYFSSNLHYETPHSSRVALHSSSPSKVIASELIQFGRVEWDYFLNQRLPDLLTRQEQE
jgi:hypothetical protein